jgi:hypothetical protein
VACAQGYILSKFENQFVGAFANLVPDQLLTPAGLARTSPIG